jgi:hypothetical protein
VPQDHPSPPWHQSQLGREHEMEPRPAVARRAYRGSGKPEGKVALITGGDSGIGRAVGVYFAREGCDCAVVYLDEDKHAEEAKHLIEGEGRRCLLLGSWGPGYWGSRIVAPSCERSVERSDRRWPRGFQNVPRCCDSCRCRSRRRRR